MQPNQNLLSPPSLTKKELIGFNVLIAAGASWIIYWLPSVFKEVFGIFGASAFLPASTQFIFDWHYMLMWLPVVWMFAFYHKDMRRGGSRTLVGTLLGSIVVLLMVIVPMYFPRFILTSISYY